MNELVGMKNFLMMYVVNKQTVNPFRRKYLWKCIGCILSSVTYWKKVQNIWSEINKYFW